MAAISESIPERASDISDDILRTLEPPTPLYVVAVLFCMGVVGAGIFALAYQTYMGFGGIG